MPTPMRFPWGKGTLKLTRAVSTDDSDVSLIVPTGKVWRMLYIQVQIATTADAGNRVLNTAIWDGSTNYYYPATPTANIIASKYGGIRMYFESSGADSTTVYPRYNSNTTNLDIALTVFRPTTYLPAGTQIRLWDSAAIQPAADDINYTVQYIEYDA